MSLLKALHWVESTSDKASSDIMMNDLGLQAETLLDALQEDNDTVKNEIKALRKTTRDRKKEIAEERRARALVGMSSFGPLAGVGTDGASRSPPRRISAAAGGGDDEDLVPGGGGGPSAAKQPGVGSVSAQIASMIGLSAFAAALASSNQQRNAGAAEPSSAAVAALSSAAQTSGGNESEWQKWRQWETRQVSLVLSARRVARYNRQNYLDCIST